MWVRIDEGFVDHPKVAQAGPLAMALQVAALCYCNRQLTDGFIPRAVARTLVDWQGEDAAGRRYAIAVTSGMGGEDVTSDWVIELLLEAGIWEEAPGGYQLHDYHDYQPSREAVEADRAAVREQRAAAGRASAAARRRTGPGAFERDADEQPTAYPTKRQRAVDGAATVRPPTEDAPAAHRTGTPTEVQREPNGPVGVSLGTPLAAESGDQREHQRDANGKPTGGQRKSNTDPDPDPDPGSDPASQARGLARRRGREVRRAREPDDVWQAVKAQARGRYPDRLEELEALAVERGRGELLAQAVRHTQRQEPRSFWPYLVATIEGCLDTGEIPGNPPPTVPAEPASRPARAGPAKADGLPDDARIAEIERTDPERAAWLRDLRAKLPKEVATADT